jgi:hypothetical protein
VICDYDEPEWLRNPTNAIGGSFILSLTKRLTTLPGMDAGHSASSDLSIAPLGPVIPSLRRSDLSARRRAIPEQVTPCTDPSTARVLSRGHSYGVWQSHPPSLGRILGFSHAVSAWWDCESQARLCPLMIFSQ